jgi:hypothetical protein
MNKLTSRTFRFTLLFTQVGRMDGSHAEIIDPEIARIWSEAPTSLSHRDYQIEGDTVSVSVNWRRLAERIRIDNQLNLEVEEGRPPKNWFARVTRPLAITAKAVVRGAKAASSIERFAATFVEVFLHEVFLIANLAVPGSAEFWNLSIVDRNSKDGKREIRLSSLSFEIGWISCLNGGSPAIKALPRDEVCNWFAEIDMGYRQRSRNGIESALYVLLHIAQRDTEIDTLIWLFHGLESLVSTKIGENFSGLVRRLGMILDLKPPEETKLKRKLRELYNLRSAFVHGGYAVPHPMRNDIIDKSLKDHMDRVFDAWLFGTSLLISALQALISKRIISLKFDENLVACTMQDNGSSKR